MIGDSLNIKVHGIGRDTRGVLKIQKRRRGNVSENSVDFPVGQVGYVNMCVFPKFDFEQFGENVSHTRWWGLELATQGTIGELLARVLVGKSKP